MNAMAQDDELVFSFPVKKIIDLVKGLELRAKNTEYDLGLPVKNHLLAEYELRPTYKKIGKLMGMDWL